MLVIVPFVLDQLLNAYVYWAVLAFGVAVIVVPLLNTNLLLFTLYVVPCGMFALVELTAPYESAVNVTLYVFKTGATFTAIWPLALVILYV